MMIRLNVNKNKYAIVEILDDEDRYECEIGFSCDSCIVSHDKYEYNPKVDTFVVSGEDFSYAKQFLKKLYIDNYNI